MVILLQLSPAPEAKCGGCLSHRDPPVHGPLKGSHHRNAAAIRSLQTIAEQAGHLTHISIYRPHFHGGATSTGNSKQLGVTVTHLRS